jgi:hypothetical protein
MVANSIRTLSLSVLRRVLVVDGGVEVVNRRVRLSVVGENNIGAPKIRHILMPSQIGNFAKAIVVTFLLP